MYLPAGTNRYARKGVSTGRWQLFNVTADPGETRDLSQAEPARLVAVYDARAKAKGVVSLPPSDAHPVAASQP